jgi:ubiquinone/menaquinone biosynthesis C-methylase UbiE
MIDNPRVTFFDDLASKWDSFEDLDALQRRLATELGRFGLSPNDRILDVGCGTGNLTQALLTKLGPEGRVMAVDISAQMLTTARSKITDDRVFFHQADATALPIPDCRFDHAFCFGVWPHFDDHRAIAAELFASCAPAASCTSGTSYRANR